MALARLLLLVAVGGCFSTPELADDDGGATLGCDVTDDPDLVVYLTLDQLVDNKVTDASPQHHVGTVFGSLELVPGRVGQALHWDAQDDVIDLGSDTTVDQLRAVSACMWIYPGASSDDMTLLDKSADGSMGGWNVFLVDKDNTVGLGFVNRSAVYEQTAGVINRDAWTHVCTTWDGSDGQRVNDALEGVHLWVGGDEVPPEYVNEGLRQAPTTDAPQPLRVGSGRTGGTDFTFRGLIDEVMLFRRELTAAEVRAIASCAP